MVLVLCALWFLLLAHHRTISGAKWAVVAAFEEHLPARPFSCAEWQGELQGDRYRRGWRWLTKLEQAVPITFAVIYVVGAVLLILAAP